MLMRGMTLLVAAVRRILFIQAAEMMSFTLMQVMMKFTPQMEIMKIINKYIWVLGVISSAAETVMTL